MAMVPGNRAATMDVQNEPTLAINESKASLSSSNGASAGHVDAVDQPAILEHISLNHRRTTTNDQEKIILGPYDYYSSQPGKHMRSTLIDAFNAWLHVPVKQLDAIKKVIEMLHNASLLIDDIQDSSDLRRGRPSAHHVFGVAQTINSANYVYFQAVTQLCSLTSPRALDIFAEELLNLHKGQGMELYWRDSLICPTEIEYLEMVSNKTGGLLRLAVKLMQDEVKSTVDYIPLADVIGIAYQIRDDFINLCSEEYKQQKGANSDLGEGKFSYPIIHSIRTRPSNHQLVNILKQRTKDPDLQRLAVSTMIETQSFEYCREQVATLIQSARSMVVDYDKIFPREFGIEKVLDHLSQMS